MEIVESRYKRNSMIFCSRFDIPGWPEELSDLLLADAICDRMKTKSLAASPSPWNRSFPNNRKSGQLIERADSLSCPLFGYCIPCS